MKWSLVEQTSAFGSTVWTPAWPKLTSTTSSMRKNCQALFTSRKSKAPNMSHGYVYSGPCYRNLIFAEFIDEVFAVSLAAALDVPANVWTMDA